MNGLRKRPSGRFFLSLLLAGAVAGPVGAQCYPGETPLVACTVDQGRKVLSTCLSGREASYSFGRANAAPDLLLTRDVTQVDLEPWPGIGGTIWEVMVFENAGHLYRVYHAIDRTPGAAMPLSGGVEVEKAGEVIAALECDPGSVVSAGYPLPLSQAKQDAGQVFDPNTRRWR